MAKTVSQDEIIQAIEGKKIVRFKYSGLPRTCEPHVLGITNGRLQLLCWQISGPSRGGDPSPWRRFDVGTLSNYHTTNDTFPGARPVPYPHSKWDEVILSVS